MGSRLVGSEFNTETLDEYKKKEKEEEMQYRLPFGGGSGAGVTINPVAFLVINKDTIKLMPIDHTSSLDRIIDYVPDILGKVCNCVKEKCEDNNEETSSGSSETSTESKAEKVVIKSEIKDDDYLEDE